jgi:hypothetical protein
MMRVSRVLTRIALRAGLLGTLGAALACDSATISVTGPSGEKCEISVTNNSPELPASGGDGSLTIATSRDCTWSASADAAWVSLAATSGQGPATVNYSVLPNSDGTARRSRIVVARREVDVAQAAAACRYDVSPPTLNVDAAEHQSVVTVSAPNGCAWTARTDVPWLGRAAPPDGSGTGTVRFTIAANPSDARTGTVVVANATVRVNQSGAIAGGPPAPQPPAPSPTPPPSPGPTPPPLPGLTCTYDVAPERMSVAAAADEVTIAVTASGGCPWTAISNVSWIVVVSGAEGSGSGSVRLSVGENTGSARSERISIAGRTVTIDQQVRPAQPCSYRLSPASRNLGPVPETFAVEVSAPAGCTWTVSNDAPWLSIVSGRSGAGVGTFQIAASGNSGGPRSGSVRVASETLTVQQAGGCTYSIKPNDYHSGRGPDTITIDVTANSGCAWTTVSDAAWVTIAAGRSGTGNGAVRLEIPANNGPARTAVVTIAGKTFTLLQNGLCASTIKPGYYDAGRGPDNILIRVSAEIGCTWTSASTVSWVSVAEGASGSGDGIVRLLVQPNSGAARAVTLTIAGQAFALTQKGSQ